MKPLISPPTLAITKLRGSRRDDRIRLFRQQSTNCRLLNPRCKYSTGRNVFACGRVVCAWCRFGRSHLGCCAEVMPNDEDPAR